MIDFMSYRRWYALISAIVIVPGLLVLLISGLRPAIDFTGGSLLEIQSSKIKNQNENEVREIVEKQDIGLSSIQSSGEDSYILRMKPIENKTKENIILALEDEFGEVEEVRFETVGPTLGRELLIKTIIAGAVAVVAILLYIAWTFKNVRFGLSAIVALAHDLLIVVGIFAILGQFLGVEVDALFVTAILTTMSFSVHDTIVVFDRISEKQHRLGKVPFQVIVNSALTETMARSLNNSLTIIFMLLALFLMGGNTIRWFVLALLIGTIAGTYSSPFVATPVLYIWVMRTAKKG